MKQLQHAQPTTPKKSKKSRDYEDIVGQRPSDYPEVLADATYTGGSVQR